MAKEYKIVQEIGTYWFERTINELMAEGWMPTGAFYYHLQPKDHPDHAEYFQPMIREVDNNFVSKDV